MAPGTAEPMGGRPGAAAGGATTRGYFTTLLELAAARVGVVVILIAAVSLTEGLGLLLVVPLLETAGLDVQQGAIAGVARWWASLFRALGVSPTLPAVLAMYLAIVSAAALLQRWQTLLVLELREGFARALRGRLYWAIARTRWVVLSQSRSSEFAHALTAELDRVAVATHHFLFLIANAAVALVYLLLAVQLSPALTALVCLSGGLLVALMRRKIDAARRSGELFLDATSALYAATLEHLSTLKLAKSYDVLEQNFATFARTNERVTRGFLDTLGHPATVKCWFDIGSAVLLSLVVYVSLQVIGVSTAQLLVLLLLFVKLLPRFSSIVQDSQRYAGCASAFAHVVALEARCRAAAEPPALRDEPIGFRRAIRLAGVSFGYDPARAPVICDLDLVIRAGETTAIVGASGAGKSTLADLLLGLLVPDRGRISVDDTPLDPERLRPWRVQVGYVPQETVLFHDTLRANLLWAKPDATEEDLRRALSLGGAGEFVWRLPQGLDTVLGDRGVLLSGGERQRVALARALLRRPALLILDEATSSLDAENEERVQRAIESLCSQMTIVVITHRPSAIRGADVIHVLDEGRIVESGTWAALAGREGSRFRALYASERAADPAITLG